MSEIGYYNYYNNPHRYSPDTVQDRYQQMVDAYNSDKLKAKDSFSNPYSDLNISRTVFRSRMKNLQIGQVRFVLNVRQSKKFMSI